jgi:protein-S-isoprenylcysteine O-methyltransferase Ste14
MHEPFTEILIALILILGAVWFFIGLKFRHTLKREPLLSSIFHGVLLVFGLIMPLVNEFHTEFLAWRFIPRSTLIEIIGVIVAGLGIGFAIWSRFVLGSNWSSAVAIKAGQHLVQYGPYAIVRNPIYTGIIFFMFGAALNVGELRGLAGIGLVMITLWHKAKMEERFLSEEFGEEYLAYQKRTNFIIPFII